MVLVSIFCETYNHRAYVKDALEGFLMQKTNFEFEVLIHDDASTDGTQDVIREYASKYPHIIKPIYQIENQYSKGISIWSKIQYPRAEGKYIAICEGDDYWTDPLKLQKQIDFLEESPDYIMVFTNAIIHYQDDSREDIVMNNIPESTVDPYRLYTEWWSIPTASFCVRRQLFEFSKYKKSVSLKKVPFGDLQIAICAGLMGKIHFIDEPSVVYRILKTGAANYLFSHQLEHLYGRIRVAKIFGKSYLASERHKLVSYLIPFIKNNNYKYLLICLKYAPRLTLIELATRACDKIRKII